MPTEKTVDVGGVAVRLILTDDAYVTAHIDESYESHVFSLRGETETAALPVGTEFAVRTDAGNDTIVYFNDEDNLTDYDPWDACVNDYDVTYFDSGMYFNEVTVEEFEPIPEDDSVQTEMDGEMITVVADNGVVDAFIETSRAEQFVEKIRGWGDAVQNGLYKAVIDTSGEGADDHHAAIIALSIGLHDNAADLEPDGAVLTYIAAVDDLAVDSYGLPEEFVGDIVLMYGDPERSDDVAERESL